MGKRIRKMSEMYGMTIKPALKPEDRHRIQDKLKELGYRVIGGGTCTDMSECDISFEKRE